MPQLSSFENNADRNASSLSLRIEVPETIVQNGVDEKALIRRPILTTKHWAVPGRAARHSVVPGAGFHG